MLYGTNRWTIKANPQDSALKTRQWLDAIDFFALTSIRALSVLTDVCVCDDALEARETAVSKLKKLDIKTTWRASRLRSKDKTNPIFFSGHCKDCGSEAGRRPSREVKKFVVSVDFDDAVNSKLRNGDTEALKRDLVAVVEIVHSLRR
jgi:hypothetical protein